MQRSARPRGGAITDTQLKLGAVAADTLLELGTTLRGSMATSLQAPSPLDAAAARTPAAAGDSLCAPALPPGVVPQAQRPLVLGKPPVPGKARHMPVLQAGVMTMVRAL